MATVAINHDASQPELIGASSWHSVNKTAAAAAATAAAAAVTITAIYQTRQQPINGEAALHLYQRFFKLLYSNLTLQEARSKSGP